MQTDARALDFCNNPQGFSWSPCLAGLATNLLKLVQQNNGTMHVHNRTAAKADPLVKQGATWASSPASIGKQCSITLSCVFSDTALKEVFTAYLSGHPKQGSLYIDCSTVSPDTIRELDAKAKAAGDPTKVTMTQRTTSSSYCIKVQCCKTFLWQRLPHCIHCGCAQHHCIPKKVCML